MTYVRSATYAVFLALGLLAYAGVKFVQYQWRLTQSSEETRARLILNRAHERRAQMIAEENDG